MNTEENETIEPSPPPEPTFAPPIRVSVHTNNLSKCELRISGADGVAKAIVIPSDGNVYQGLHRARQGIEDALNEVLAAHGITAPELELEAAPEATPTEPDAPAPKKKAAAKAKVTPPAQ